MNTRLDISGYNFEWFENTVKKENTLSEKKPELKVVKGAKQKTRLKTSVRLFVIFTVMAVFVAGMYLFLSERAYCDNIDREIGRTEKEIQYTESENVRLRNQIEADSSIVNVVEYATNELGMIKGDGQFVEYIDLCTEDEVIICNGEPVQKDN